VSKRGVVAAAPWLAHAWARAGRAPPRPPTPLPPIFCPCLGEARRSAFFFSLNPPPRPLPRLSLALRLALPPHLRLAVLFFHPLPADCSSQALDLANGSCKVVWSLANVAAKYGQSQSCDELKSAASKYSNGGLSSDCCDKAKSFVTSGCACSKDVVDLLGGLRVLPAGDDPALALSGIINLLQASNCGAIYNPCTSSSGCASSA
jgi:hypothetical protein